MKRSPAEVDLRALASTCEEDENVGRLIADAYYFRG